MKTLNDIKLSDLVPANVKKDSSVMASISALESQISEITELCTAPALYARIDQMPGEQLDHLAWQLDSKVWRDSWPVSLKRSVIKTVISEKTRKGTKKAVVEAVDAFGSGAEVKEWFETGGEPHTFSVDVSLSKIDNLPKADQQAHLSLRINEVKPLRSRFSLTLTQLAEAGMGIAGGSQAAVFNRLISLGIPPAALGAGEYNMACGEATAHSRT